MRMIRTLSQDSLKTIFFISLSVFFLGGLVFAFPQTGLISQNFPSNVSVTPFRVLAYTFNGATTNFTGRGEATYANFPNVILERTSYGKIQFNQNLDLITMATNNTVDFDSYVNISNNIIYVNNNNLPGINKSATLSFYNMNFTSPELYHDGSLCGSACSFISYSGGIYKFSVSSFSGLYFLREKTVTPPSPPPSGGGGGGGASSNVTNKTVAKGVDFSVNPTFFTLEMNKGTYYQKAINVTNNGTAPITIRIAVSGLQNYIFPEENSLTLKPGESQIVKFDVYVSNSVPADVYVGKIIFASGALQRDSNAILKVNGISALFDIKVNMVKKYIEPGGTARANITVLNRGDLRDFDVNITYEALDFNNHIYTIKKEVFAINQAYNNVFSLQLPKNMTVGTYIFYAKVDYKNVSAAGYDTFVIEDISTASWFVLIIIILITMYLVYWFYKRKKRELATQMKAVMKKEAEVQEKRSQLPLEVPELPDKL